MFLLHLIPVKVQRVIRLSSLSKEVLIPLLVSCPTTHGFWVVSALLYALTTLDRKKTLIYIQTHFVHFSFIQRLLVLYSSHVYANATHLA